MLWGDEKLHIAEFIEIVLWLNIRPDLSEVVGDIEGGPISDVFQEVQCRYRNTKTWRRRLPLCTWVHARVDRRRTTFLSILGAVREMKASDKRDYIYAFLGLPTARTVDNLHIAEPDYSKEVYDIFTETASSILQKTRDAGWLLGYVDHDLDEDIMAEST
jgi:hypothetical protein